MTTVALAVLVLQASGKREDLGNMPAEELCPDLSNNLEVGAASGYCGETDPKTHTSQAQFSWSLS